MRTLAASRWARHGLLLCCTWMPACGGGALAGPVAPRAEVAPAAQEGTTPSADGVAIHYRSVGSGDAAVVLVHGWSCSSRYWDETVRSLAQRWRVVTLDLAGHGLSGKSRERWTMTAFGQDVEAVVTALGLRRVVLVGHSMGGPVILEATIRMPDRVVGLVPVDTLHNVENEMPDADRERLFARLRLDFRGTTAAIVQQLFLSTSDKAVVDRVLADMTGADPAVAVPALEALFRYKEALALEQTKVPIVAINADVRPTNVEANRRHAPQFDAVVMKGVGHWPMLERPAELDARLMEVVVKMHLTQ
jgi:pimeloyl-ACP methyl ester carboxylesterase